MTGNPKDLDEKALRQALTLAIEAKRATWVGGSDGEFDPFLADAAWDVVAPLIAELRQHREAQQWEYAVRVVATGEICPTSIARHHAPDYCEGVCRSIGPWQPVPPEETP